MTMKKPKGMTSKTRKQHLAVDEMNRRIIRKKMKNSLYIPDWLGELLMDSGEYKANKKKKK